MAVGCCPIFPAWMKGIKLQFSSGISGPSPSFKWQLEMVFVAIPKLGQTPDNANCLTSAPTGPNRRSLIRECFWINVTTEGLKTGRTTGTRKSLSEDIGRATRKHYLSEEKIKL